MKSDRDLLELAAKAAGYEFSWSDKYGCAEIWVSGDKKKAFWQPHIDDGDALRLSNRLNMAILHFPTMGMYTSVKPLNAPSCKVCWDGIGINAATRLAIVRAAASIGESMQ